MLSSTFPHSHQDCSFLGLSSGFSTNSPINSANSFPLLHGSTFPFLLFLLLFDFRLLYPAFCSSCYFLMHWPPKLHFKFLKNRLGWIHSILRVPCYNRSSFAGYWLTSPSSRRNGLQGGGEFCHLLWLCIPETTDAVDHGKETLMISRPETSLD